MLYRIITLIHETMTLQPSKKVSLCIFDLYAPFGYNQTYNVVSRLWQPHVEADLYVKLQSNLIDMDMCRAA